MISVWQLRGDRDLISSDEGMQQFFFPLCFFFSHQCIFSIKFPSQGVPLLDYLPAFLPSPIPWVYFQRR